MAAAPNYGVLIAGQVLTGIGCGPAFLVCTVFIARSFPAGRFAAVNGAALGIGSVGLLLTGTPLAWTIEAASWRAGFVALAAIAAIAWVAIFVFVRDGTADEPRRTLNVGAALRGYGELFKLPHTIGIFALALTTYSSFMALRGLWLGPMLIERHGFTPGAGRQRRHRDLGGRHDRPAALRPRGSRRPEPPALDHGVRARHRRVVHR